MNYKSEINEFKNHRDKYIPILRRVLSASKDKQNIFPLSIIDDKDLQVILELIDLEYLNEKAFILNKNFGNIDNVLLRGSDPLTSSGYNLLNNNYKARRKLIILTPVILIITVLMLYLILK